MPTYDYRCKSCNRSHEIEHGFNDPRPTQCPDCGGRLVRVFHPVGVVFKGAGFHKTDYAKSSLKKDAAAAPSSDGAKSESKSESSKPEKGAPASTQAPAAKPAPKPASEGGKKS